MDFLNHTEESLTTLLVDCTLGSKKPETAKLEITALLNAAQLGDITNHKIESIDFQSWPIGDLIIHTYFPMKDSEGDDTSVMYSKIYTIPSSIVFSDDPIKAASEYGWENKIEKVKEKLDRSQDLVAKYQSELSDLRFQYHEFKRNGRKKMIQISRDNARKEFVKIQKDFDKRN